MAGHVSRASSRCRSRLLGSGLLGARRYSGGLSGRRGRLARLQSSPSRASRRLAYSASSRDLPSRSCMVPVTDAQSRPRWKRLARTPVRRTPTSARAPPRRAVPSRAPSSPTPALPAARPAGRRFRCTGEAVSCAGRSRSRPRARTVRWAYRSTRQQPPQRGLDMPSGHHHGPDAVKQLDLKRSVCCRESTVPRHADGAHVHLRHCGRDREVVRGAQTVVERLADGVGPLRSQVAAEPALLSDSEVRDPKWVRLLVRHIVHFRDSRRPAHAAQRRHPRAQAPCRQVRGSRAPGALLAQPATATGCRRYGGGSRPAGRRHADARERRGGARQVVSGATGGPQR